MINSNTLILMSIDINVGRPTLELTFQRTGFRDHLFFSAKTTFWPRANTFLRQKQVRFESIWTHISENRISWSRTFTSEGRFTWIPTMLFCKPWAAVKILTATACGKQRGWVQRYLLTFFFFWNKMGEGWAISQLVGLKNQFFQKQGVVLWCQRVLGVWARWTFHADSLVHPGG